MKLDVGCGLNLKKPLDEWVHLDVDEGPHIEIVTDFIVDGIPLDDGVVDEIWVGDVVEHIPVWLQAVAFKEWCRVLKPGGVLAGTTPNLERTIQQYVKGEITFEWLLQNLYGDRSGYPHQHYILFTAKTLTELLTNHGFTDVDLSGSPGDKADPWWFVFQARKA